MIKKYLIPHADNDYKPHVFREASVALFLAIILVVFVSSVALSSIVNNLGLTAAIYSSVIADSTNKDRAVTSNLAPLAVNPLLEAAAEAKANDMAKKGYFSHTGPDGTTPWYWISQAGYPYLYAGENLAVDFTDSQSVENAWMNSPDHRANILNSHFTEVGIGTAEGMLDGKSTIFVVQMFGSERPVQVAAVIPQNSIPVVSSSHSSTTPIVPKVAVTVKPKVIPTTASSTNEEVETVSSGSNFLAVRVKGESISPATPIAASMALPHYSNWYEKLIVNPSATLEIIYIVLAAFIIISLLLFIFIERRVQHPKNIAYACMLLVIILGLFFFHQVLFPSELVVI